jgi:hypothetical protein
VLEGSAASRILGTNRVQDSEAFLIIICSYARNERIYRKDAINNEEDERQSQSAEVEGEQSGVLLQVPWKGSPQPKQLRCATFLFRSLPE